MNKSMKEIILKPIGIVNSPVKDENKVPIQSKFSNLRGTIEIHEEYVEGLKDIEEYKYIICISFLHRIKKPVSLITSSHWDQRMHGVFATRSPKRPNPVAFSIFQLLNVENNILYVNNIDLIDQTPILDIKPFIPSIDNREFTKKEQ
ncbi:MAG: tRNA (N6-threonylcarbamoyladenosine(37)-N6)-methyltransferase TrmO [Promethearchaeota archaeon]